MKKLFKGVLLFTILSTIVLMGCTAGEAVYIQSDETLSIQSDTTLDVAVDGSVNSVLVNADGDTITVDSNTRTLVNIDYEHHMVHQGKMFTVIEVTDLGNGAVRDILIVTPDTTEWAHMVWEVEHELETMVQFYCGATYSDNGTAISSFNRNSNSNNTATTLIYHTPTITDVGELIATIQQGDGKKAGGGDRVSNEYVLRQNCAFLIRITNSTTSQNLVAMKLNWYELIDNN